MPINPLISLQAKAPNIGQAFSNALMDVSRIDALRQGRAEAPMRSRLLEAQTAQQEAAVPSPVARDITRQQEIIKSLGIGAQQIIPDLQAGRTEQVLSSLQRRRQELIQAGQPTDETDEAIQLAQTNPAELLTRSQQAVDLASQMTVGKGGVQFGGQQTFKDEEGNLFFGTTKRDPQSGAIASVLAPIGGGPTEPTGRVKLVSQLGETAEEQLETEIAKESRKESEKLKVQKKFKPQIEKAVIAARKEATERGDVFNELSQAKAALPGLTRAVDELKELSQIATSTFGGRVFDTAVKETGFGATKGATARAKFIAIVNNQVLPLLKPTFGGSFSVQEGESLKATMGDPDSSPAEKMAQLEAFISQKVRDIETKQSQLNIGQSVVPQTQSVAPTQTIKFDRQGNRIP
jgi:hypothetical protein